MEQENLTVLKRVEQAENAIKGCQQQINNCVYNVKRRLDQFGLIYALPSQKEIVEGLSYLKSKFSNNTESYTELGLTSEEDAEQKYLGYTYTEWLNDMQTRVRHLNAIFLIKKNNTILRKLIPYLSDEEKRERALKEISEIENENISTNDVLYLSSRELGKSVRQQILDEDKDEYFDENCLEEDED